MRTGGVVMPWGEPVGAVRILGMPLRERQERLARRAGIVVAGEADRDAVSEPDTLYWDDDVDVSWGALRAWLKVAGSGAQMALVERPGRVGEIEVEPAIDLGGPARLVGLRWGPGGRPVLVPPLGLDGRTALAGPFDAEVPWYLTARTAVTVRHWLHLLRANLAALGVDIFERLVLRPWNVAWAWARSPLRPRFVSIGRNCDIHPTARLEGCVLGDGVRVGAFSALRGCWIGDGASIEDHVTARGGIMGRKSHIANFGVFNLSVLGERSSLGHFGAQACVLGDGCFVSTFATLMDLNLRGNAKVRFDGRLADVGIPFCGSAIGHGVRLGANVTLAPGREIPNGVHVMAEDNVIGRLTGEETAGEYRVREGRLVRV